MTQPTTTCRAILGAVPATDDPALWDENFAAMIAAKEATDRYDEAVFEPLYERKKAFEQANGVADLFPINPKVKHLHEADGYRHAIPEDIYDRQQELCDGFVETQSAVMATPAPHLSALRWKLDHILVIEHDDEPGGGSTPSWRAAYVRQMLADIASLLPETV